MTPQEVEQEVAGRLGYLEKIYRKTPFVLQTDSQGRYTESFSALLYTIAFSSSWFNSFPPDVSQSSKTKAARLLATSGAVAVLCQVAGLALQCREHRGQGQDGGQAVHASHGEDLFQDAADTQDLEQGETMQDLGQGEMMQDLEQGETMQDLGQGETMQDLGQGETMQDLGQGETMQDLGHGETMQDLGQGETMQDLGQGETMQDLGQGETMQDLGQGETTQDLEQGEMMQDWEGTAEEWRDALTSLVNFTDISQDVCLAVREDVTFLPMLVHKLADWSQQHLEGRLQRSLEEDFLECGLAIIGNLALRDENVVRLRDLSLAPVLLPYVQSPSARCRLLTMSALADLTVNKECELLTLSPDLDLADLLLDHLRRALASDARSWNGFGVTDLLRTLQRLAWNNPNSRLLVEKGALPLLTQCMLSQERKEHEYCLTALHMLVRNKLNVPDVVEEQALIDHVTATSQDVSYREEDRQACREVLSHLQHDKTDTWIHGSHTDIPTDAESSCLPEVTTFTSVDIAQNQLQAATPSAQNQLQAATPSAQNQLIPATPSAQNQLQAATPSAQNQLIPATPSAQDQLQAATPSAQNQLQAATPSAQNQLQAATPSAQNQLIPATSSAQNQLQAATPSAQNQLIPATPSAQNQLQAATPSAQNQLQAATPSAQNQLIPATPSAQNQLQAATEYWRSCLLRYFPRLHSQTYFVPPLHFNRQPFVVQHLASQTVCVLQSPAGQPTCFTAVSGCLPPVVAQQSTSQSTHLPPAAPRASGPSAVGAGGLVPDFQPVAGRVWGAGWPGCTPPHARVGDNEVRDDRAQQHVLHCLRALFQSLSEAAVVVSQLQFGDYLNKPCYAPAAAQLPRPLTLAPNLRRGDFDVLVIDMRHGLLVGEVKSVGSNMAALGFAPARQEAELRKKVGQAVTQLDKAETVLRHVTSDLTASLTIRKTVMLPHVTSAQLLQVLTHSPQDAQGLRVCLGAATDEEAVSLCLCSDTLSSSSAPHDVTPHVLSQLTTWWRRRLADSSSNHTMAPAVYENIVARFCGPATTVRVWCPVPPRLGAREIRTEGEGVAETGERVARLTLTPEQVDLLNRSPPRAFVCGPPGTGKTVVLTLMAAEWLRQGHVVHVLSTHQQSRAASYVIERQLLHVLGPAGSASPRVRLLQYNFLNLDSNVPRQAALDLVQAAGPQGQLHVIADDVSGMDNFDEFCRQLVPRAPDVCLWAADVQSELLPHGLTEAKLTTPLRCPPVVVREVARSKFFADGSISSFTDPGTPAPTDGPAIKRLQHRRQPGHAHRSPERCDACSQAVAQILDDLQVGRTERDVSSNVNTSSRGGVNTSPTPLTFRDVMIMCENPREERRKPETGDVLTPAVTLVRALRQRGVVLQVVEQEDEAGVRELALAEHDEVAVVHWETAHGLERRVVVVAGAGTQGRHNARLYCVSRCTAQLVLIDIDPLAGEGDGTDGQSDDDSGDDGTDGQSDDDHGNDGTDEHSDYDSGDDSGDDGADGQSGDDSGDNRQDEENQTDEQSGSGQSKFT